MHVISKRIMPLSRPQIYRWLLARAIRRQAGKGECPKAPVERRRWNFPTRERRRAGDY
jgi:hypothetical protein